VLVVVSVFDQDIGCLQLNSWVDIGDLTFVLDRSLCGRKNVELVMVNVELVMVFDLEKVVELC
jgi:hypothetical protein